MFVNPACVRSVTPLMSGRTSLTLDGDGEDAELTVDEPYMVVIPLLTGRPWQEPQEALVAAQDRHAAEAAATKARIEADLRLRFDEAAGSA